MELFKQFTQMLEDFINSIVDKRLAENQRPNVGLPYNQELAAEVVKILDSNPEAREILDQHSARYHTLPALEKAVLRLLNSDAETDESTPVERAIRQIAKDATSGKYVTEREMEEYCSEFLDEDQVENGVMDVLRNNHRDMTDIIHDNLDSNRLGETLKYNDIVEDIFFDHIVDTERFNNSVKSFSNDQEFEDRVCDIIRNKL